VVALGSVVGALEDCVDTLRADGLRIGAVALTTFRPFPTAAVRAALAGARRVVVVERAFSVGVGGIVSLDVRAALGDDRPIHTVVAGLGGRPVRAASLAPLLRAAAAGDAGDLTFLDLDESVVARELSRIQASPHAALAAVAGE
jgi:pyruvate ferredoxin oxidoreductase alpha subunit